MMNSQFPIYQQALQQGLLDEKARQGKALLQDCRVCPRHCRVNRQEGELGECRIGRQAVVSSYFPHFGEEAPLVGRNGSGTIFMGGCNLLCRFCQNYETSHLREGKAVDAQRFADLMLRLQQAGCHNINIVTPSHIVPQLVEALYLAAGEGLRIPLVYNSGGYDSPESLQLLEGLVDIYMPDFKFFNDRLAVRYTAVKDYATRAKMAIREMHRQVGDLVIENGIARCGLLVRHLVMPGMLDDSRQIFQFLAGEISKDTYLNVMPQYHPAGEAGRYPEIDRPLQHSEFRQAIELARRAGLYRLDKP